MDINKAIETHYTREKMAETILDLARQNASDPACLTIPDPAPYDDMHIGGRKATTHLMDQLNLRPAQHILDIGSGIGGPARFVAEHYGTHVTGIDLTPAHKEAADRLSQAVCLDQRTTFITGSALAMPFEKHSFDAAYMIHVGMNIQNKPALYKEVARILKPGALLGIYDVMADDNNTIENFSFPVPWAETQETSFLYAPAAIKTLLEQAGFEIIHTESRRDFALSTLEKLLGSESLKSRNNNFLREARSNLQDNIRNNLCAPWEMIGRIKENPASTS